MYMYIGVGHAMLPRVAPPSLTPFNLMWQLPRLHLSLELITYDELETMECVLQHTQVVFVCETEERDECDEVEHAIGGAPASVREIADHVDSLRAQCMQQTRCKIATHSRRSCQEQPSLPRYIAACHLLLTSSRVSVSTNSSC